MPSHTDKIRSNYRSARYLVPQPSRVAMGQHAPWIYLENAVFIEYSDQFVFRRFGKKNIGAYDVSDAAIVIFFFGRSNNIIDGSIARLNLTFSIGIQQRFLRSFSRSGHTTKICFPNIVEFLFLRNETSQVACLRLNRVFEELSAISGELCYANEIFMLQEKCREILLEIYATASEKKPMDCIYLSDIADEHAILHPVDLDLAYGVCSKDISLIKTALENYANSNIAINGIPLLLVYLMYWLKDLKIPDDDFRYALELLLRYNANPNLKWLGQSLEEFLLETALYGRNYNGVLKRCYHVLEYLMWQTLEGRSWYLPTIKIDPESRYSVDQPALFLYKSRMDAIIIRKLSTPPSPKVISSICPISFVSQDMQEHMILLNNEAGGGKTRLNVKIYYLAKDKTKIPKAHIWHIFSQNFNAGTTEEEKINYFKDLFANDDTFVEILSIGNQLIAFTMWRLHVGSKPGTLIHYILITASDRCYTKKYPRLMSLVQFRTCLALQELFSEYSIITFFDVISPVFLLTIESFITSFKYKTTFIQDISKDLKEVLDLGEKDEIYYEDGQYYTEDKLGTKMSLEIDYGLISAKDLKLQKGKSLLVAFEAGKEEFAKTVDKVIGGSEAYTAINNQIIKIRSILPADSELSRRLSVPYQIRFMPKL